MNLGAIVAAHAASQPEKPAVESGEASITYRELNDLARQIASRLKGAGVQSGDLVAVRMIDSPKHVAALVAVARIGGIILPVDWRSSAMEVRRLLDSFKPRLLLTDNERPVPEDLHPVGLEGIESEPADLEAPVDLKDAPLVYALTSGTTGISKGVVVTHEEMYERSLVFSQEGMISPDDRFLPAMPLAYAAGREFHCALLICGATIVKAPSLFSAAELIAITKEKRVSVLLVPPNVGRQLLALQHDSDGHLLPHLRAYVSSTGKLTPEERSAIRARITPNLIDFYGSTGSGPISAITGPQDEASPTSAGHITARVEVEIVDEDGRSLLHNQVGAVRLRGPRITKRFVGDVESESEGIHDGWYYPGDLGSIDGNRLLHLHGRSADLIKRAGLMVHAQEVELILMLHESVAEAAVVGMPSSELGEEVAAFVVPKGSVHPRELTLHCIKHLAPYKVPVRIETIDTLPRNASGKVQKARLREMLQESAVATVSPS
jgi:acyl-CoA synthetase (AMP-forming)/AMP-acid ligase II